MSAAPERQAHCRSCGSPVTWGQTANGKRAPFNVSDGQNHFVTCAQRRQWRKSEPPKRPVQTSFLLDDEPASAPATPTPTPAPPTADQPDAEEIQRQRTAYLESRYAEQARRGAARRAARGDG